MLIELIVQLLPVILPLLTDLCDDEKRKLRGIQLAAESPQNLRRYALVFAEIAIARKQESGEAIDPAIMEAYEQLKALEV